MQSLVCPKCQGQMRTYERSGITVDQCGECRGIFLDRGELERLVDAENAFHSSGPPPQQQQQQPPPRYDDRDRDRDRKYYDNDRDRDRKYYDNDRRYDNQYHHKKKKKSFLDELFD